MIKLSFLPLLAGSEMEDEDVDIGNYEHPRSRISPVRTKKDLGLGNSSGVSSSSYYIISLLFSMELLQMFDYCSSYMNF